jgi:hypothetical protein
MKLKYYILSALSLLIGGTVLLGSDLLAVYDAKDPGATGVYFTTTTDHTLRNSYGGPVRVDQYGQILLSTSTSVTVGSIGTVAKPIANGYFTNLFTYGTSTLASPLIVGGTATSTIYGTANTSVIGNSLSVKRDLSYGDERNFGGGMVYASADSTTADDATSTLMLIPIPDRTIGIIEYTVNGLENNGTFAATENGKQAYYRLGGNVVLWGAVSLGPAVHSVAGGFIDVVASSTNIEVRVKSNRNFVWNWKGYTRVGEINEDGR